MQNTVFQIIEFNNTQKCLQILKLNYKYEPITIVILMLTFEAQLFSPKSSTHET